MQDGTRCSSYGEFHTLLEHSNISVEERTGTIDGRDYAEVVYSAMTDNGYGIGTPIKSSRIGKTSVIKPFKSITRSRK